MRKKTKEGIPIKPSTRRVNKTPVDATTFIDIRRDPGGRHRPFHVEEFVPPIPAKVVNLRGVTPPSERAKRTEVAKLNKANTEMWSDIL